MHYKFLSEAEDRDEQREVLLSLIDTNYEHMRHQENERVTFFSIYIAAFGVVIAELAAVKPYMLTVVAFALLPIFGIYSKKIINRWTDVFKAYRLLVIKHTIMLGILITKGEGGDSGRSNMLSDDEIKNIMDLSDKDLAEVKDDKSAITQETELLAARLELMNKYSHLENDKHFERHLGDSNQGSIPKYKQTGQLFSTLMFGTIVLEWGLAVYQAIYLACIEMGISMPVFLSVPS